MTDLSSGMKRPMGHVARYPPRPVATADTITVVSQKEAVEAMRKLKVGPKKLRKLVPGANDLERSRTWRYALQVEGGSARQAVERFKKQRLYYHRRYRRKGPGEDGLAPGRLARDSQDYIDLQLGSYDDGGARRFSITGPGGERETYLWMDV